MSLIEVLAAAWIALLTALFVWFAASDLVPRALHAEARLRAVTAARSVIERAAAGAPPCGPAPECTVSSAGLTLTVRSVPAGPALILYEVEARPRGATVLLRGEVPLFAF